MVHSWCLASKATTAVKRLFLVVKLPTSSFPDHRHGKAHSGSVEGSAEPRSGLSAHKLPLASSWPAKAATFTMQSCSARVQGPAAAVLVPAGRLLPLPASNWRPSQRRELREQQQQRGWVVTSAASTDAPAQVSAGATPPRPEWRRPTVATVVVASRPTSPCTLFGKIRHTQGAFLKASKHASCGPARRSPPPPLCPAVAAGGAAPGRPGPPS